MYRYNTSGKSGSSLFGVSRGKATANLVTRILDVAIAWLDRARQRRQLAELDDRLLRDIGVSRGDIEAEAAKPFWRN